MTSGEISSRLAMRVRTSARSASGSSETSCAALVAFRCARISAIVCGCSARMNFDSCCGSARSSEVKPAVDRNLVVDAIENAPRRIGALGLVEQTRVAYSTLPWVA